MSAKHDELSSQLIPSRTKELVEAGANPSIKYDINLDTFDEAAANYLDNVGLHRVSMAFRTIATDAVAKEHLQNVHVISIINGTEPKVSLDGSMLKIEGTYAKGLSGCVNDNDIAKVLDSGLRIAYHRHLHTLKTVQLPQRLKEITEVTGGPSIALLPDFSTLTTPGSVEYLDNVCCLRLLMAFRSVRDTYGAQALHPIKEVRIVNSVTERSAVLADGVLRIAQPIDRSIAPNSSNILSHDEIQISLENALGLKASQKRRDLEKSMAERTKELQEIFGVPITYEVEYSSFATDTELGFVDNVTCHRVNMAFRSFDPKSKAALQKTLKSIRIRNVKNAADKKCSVEPNGPELLLQCNYEQGLSGAFSDNVILATLKKSIPKP